MQLWNDYEGRTVADNYPLGKLLRPEGRSAFFSTSNGTGTPLVIRIIEAHFDESEILNRWKIVSGIEQPNLVTMRKYGETVLDGTPLVYAVMEPAEASLADVLRDRTLTVDEARQLATSLVAALEALHERGFVHEHIQPENIYAIDETVKLRSDCVREAATHAEENSHEVEERKNRDVHDLVIVLLQALTGHRELKGSATLLPTPFDAIIRNGLSGTWGLRQMANALAPRGSATPAARTPEKTPAQPLLPPASAPVRAMPVAPPQTPAAEKPKPQPSTQTITQPITQPSTQPIAAAVSAELPKPPLEQVRPVAAAAPDVRHRIVKPVERDPRRQRVWIATAIGAFFLLLLFWYFLRDQPAKSDAPPITTLAMPANPDNAAQAAPQPSAARTATTARTPTTAVPPAGRTQWRVVAFTYNHEDQAKKKVSSISKRTPGLNPEVFSPTGQAPYLVTLGGAMTRDDAAAFRKKAVAAGLPGDTYIQNYSR